MLCLSTIIQADREVNVPSDREYRTSQGWCPREDKGRAEQGPGLWGVGQER